MGWLVSLLLEGISVMGWFVDYMWLYLLVYIGTGALAGAVTSPVRGMGALLGSSLGIGLSVFVHMITKSKDWLFSNFLPILCARYNSKQLSTAFPVKIVAENLYFTQCQLVAHSLASVWSQSQSCLFLGFHCFCGCCFWGEHWIIFQWPALHLYFKW